MARKKTKEQIQYNMSRVRNSDTALEKLLCEELIRYGVTTFTRNNKTIFGKPDIAFIARKIAVFCDGDFWHGYDWENAQNEIKSNRDFWLPKIERNIQRDQDVTARLTVCEDGHLNDFPWVKWVHAKSKKQICGNPELKFKTGASGTEGLEGLSVTCSCGAVATLKGAFDKDCFEKLDEEVGIGHFRCDGNHPFRHVLQHGSQPWHPRPSS